MLMFLQIEISVFMKSDGANHGQQEVYRYREYNAKHHAKYQERLQAESLVEITETDVDVPRILQDVCPKCERTVSLVSTAFRCSLEGNH